MRLVDFKFKSGREYLDGIKNELLDTLRTIMRFQREIKLTKEILANPKTIAREKTVFIEKLRNIIIGFQLAE